VAINTVLGAAILEASVPHDATKVLVWVNHPTEPDVVIVGVQ
jgi:hypothetical protein